MNIPLMESDYGSQQMVFDEVDKDLPRVTKLNFNTHHQYIALKPLREDLSPDELMLHIEISENYNCKYGSEIQSMHF